MINILKKLVLDVKNSIKTGYYDDIIPVTKNKHSLKNAVLKNFFYMRFLMVEIQHQNVQ